MIKKNQLMDGMYPTFQDWIWNGVGFLCILLAKERRYPVLAIADRMEPILVIDLLIRYIKRMGLPSLFFDRKFFQVSDQKFVTNL